MDRLENNLVNRTPDAADEKLYQKHFTITETLVRGRIYSFKKDAIRKAEKNFGSLKERLSMRRMSVSSEENFEGKLFIQFVALQMVSYIKRKMDENGLFSNYTIQSLLDELDIIEFYQQPGKAYHLSEITEKQRKLYELMDVAVPT